jgi:hypothetical protein
LPPRSNSDAAAATSGSAAARAAAARLEGALHGVCQFSWRRRELEFHVVDYRQRISERRHRGGGQQRFQIFALLVAIGLAVLVRIIVSVLAVLATTAAAHIR